MGVSSPGDRLDEVALAAGLEEADRDGDIHLTTDSDDEVGMEAAAVPTRLKAAKVEEELFDEYRDRADRLANLQLLDRSVNNEKRASLPAEWLHVHCRSPEFRKVYCDRHQLGDVPEKITEFTKFYSKRRERLLGRIAQLVNTV